jgi:hypothetical protein
MYDRRFGRGAVMDHRRGLPAVIVAFAFLAFPAGALAQDALGTVTGAAATAVPSVTQQVPSPAPAAPIVRQAPKPAPAPSHLEPRPGPVASPAHAVRQVGASVERAAPAAAPALHAVTRAATGVPQPAERAVRSLTGALAGATHITRPAVFPLIAPLARTGPGTLTGIARFLSDIAAPVAPAGAVLGTDAAGTPGALAPAGRTAAGVPPAFADPAVTAGVRHAVGTAPATPARDPSAPNLPGVPSGSVAGPAGAAAFAGFALLFAVLALLPAGALRRLRLAPAMVGPAPFVSLLERPG